MQFQKTISLAAAMLVAGSAFAHDGEHAQTTLAAVIEHYAAHLDHLIPLAIALIVAGLAVAKPGVVARAWRAVSRRQPK